MSGGWGVDTVGLDAELAELTKKVMVDFNVDEKTAERIIAFFNELTLTKMRKWVSIMRKRQKEKADDVYRLTKALKHGRLKPGGKGIVDKIEKLILELCVET